MNLCSVFARVEILGGALLLLGCSSEPETPDDWVDPIHHTKDGGKQETGAQDGSSQDAPRDQATKDSKADSVVKDSTPPPPEGGGCSVDSHCNAAKPYCVSGACVECKSESNCPSERPLCKSGVCKEAPPACGEGSKPTDFTWPVPDVHNICQAFKNPISYQTCGFHTGIDVCGSDGLPMLAIAAGKVVYVGPLWLEGASVGRGPYAIVVQHSKDFYSTYSHNRKAEVSKGDCVTKGQEIAEMGNLGYSNGPHLHFEMLEGTPFTGDWETPFENACNHYVDPMDYVSP